MIKLKCFGAWALIASAAGCGSSESIRTYTVTSAQDSPIVAKLPSDKEAEPVVADPADGSRTLGVIIPFDDGQSRYVKFRGPKSAIATQEAAFAAFVKSMTDAGSTATLPTYTLPAGWKEKKTTRQFVAKTFAVAASVPDVTLSEPIRGSLLDNVNRWRKENGADEVTEAELPKAVTELTIGTRKAYYFDTSGPAAFTAGGMRGPFQGGKK